MALQDSLWIGHFSHQKQDQGGCGAREVIHGVVLYLEVRVSDDPKGLGSITKGVSKSHLMVFKKLKK